MSEENAAAPAPDTAPATEKPEVLKLTGSSSLAFGDSFGNEGEDYAFDGPQHEADSEMEGEGGDAYGFEEEGKPAETEGTPEKPAKKAAKINRDNDFVSEGGHDDVVGADETEKPAVKEVAKPKAETKKNVQSRFNQLTFDKNQLAREKLQLENELAAFKAAKAGTSPSRADGEELTVTDFSSYAEFEKYKEEQESRGTQKPAPDDKTVPAEGRTPLTKQQLDAYYNFQTAKETILNDVDCLERFADFETAIKATTHFPVELVHICADLENPGEAAYFLAKNPEFTKTLDAMTTAKKILAIGKFVEAGGRTAPAKTGKVVAKKISTAPAPVEPVRGRNVEADTEYDDLSVEQTGKLLENARGILQW